MERTVEVYIVVVFRGQNEVEGIIKIYVKIVSRRAAHLFPKSIAKIEIEALAGQGQNFN